jgi:hypothetical protein
VSRCRPSRPLPAELPLDDPRWVPLPDVHQLFWQRTGSWYLAAVDLRKALRTRGLRSMIRYLPRERIHRPELPERELLSADYWDDPSEIWPSDDGLLVRDKKRQGVFGYFYAWGPDIEEFFGDKTPAPQPQQQPQEDGWAVRRAKELMAAVLRNGEWRTMGPKEVCSACEPEAKRRQVKLPSPDSFSRAMGRRPGK